MLLAELFFITFLGRESGGGEAGKFEEGKDRAESEWRREEGCRRACTDVTVTSVSPRMCGGTLRLNFKELN